MPSNKKKRVYQTIVEHVKSAIERKEMIPGDKLPSERTLASHLSVSRTSVKEAYSVLESAGLVEIKHGSGVILLKDNTEDIIMKMNVLVRGESFDIVELMEFRQAIEGETAYLAAVRCNEDDANTLEQAFRRFEKTVSGKDAEVSEIGAKEDLDFHMCIARISRNLLFVEVMYMIYGRLYEALKDAPVKTVQIPGRNQTVLAEHYKLFTAIKDKNPELAREAMTEHLQSVKQIYL